MVQCTSIRPSLCPICPLRHRAEGLLLWSRQAGDIGLDSCMAGATTAQGMQQQMYAGSATLTTIVVT